MSLRINTNIQSLAAQRALGANTTAQNNSLERLSSGNRINRAGDDAAGLAISENLKASIRSLNQANRNANDGVSLIQVAEGAMSEVGNILVRMRELSIQTASDTLNDTERGFVDKEIQHLKGEINRIAQSTEFNGRKLLDGSEETLEFQVGMHNNPGLDRIQFESKSLITNLEALGIGEISTGTKANAQSNLDMLDGAISKLNSNRASLGALQNRLQSTINNLTVYSENMAAANARIRDTDFAYETAELTKSNILTQSTVSVLGQANATPQAALKLIG